jgi:hypothetical protein
MERKCSQTVKVQFPTRVFYGSEVTVDVPKSGDYIRNVRLVVEFPDSQNTLGERIVDTAEILTTKSLEKIYGEYIHVENNFTVSKEKRNKLDELLCTTNTGTMYLELPFMCTSSPEGIFLPKNETVQIRILFSSYYQGEINGYLLIDYYIVENPPIFPYVQRVNQIQKFTRVCTSPKSLKMSVYAVGPIYQLYFTVKDTTTGEYIDALTNIRLNFGEKERFNLTGQYLRYAETLKRGLHSREDEPMYVYSFCTDPLNTVVPSGSTHFNDKSYFVLDFYDNESTYEVTIWAKNYDFVYATENTIKPIFESTEILLDTTAQEVSNFQSVPLRVSYINYSGSIVVFY